MTLQERYDKGKEELQKALERAKQVFKYRSGQIESILGSVERYIGSSGFYRDVKRSGEQFGYGLEIADEAKKIEEVMNDLMELHRSWNSVESDKDGDEYEDSLKGFENQLKEFNNHNKQASNRDREIVARVMERLR